MKIEIRKCVIDDLDTLIELSKKTFYETFSHMNTPENMSAYLKQAFDVNKMRDELSNKNSVYYFLYADKELSGYLKLNENEAQTDIKDFQSLEIQRIYIKKEFQGKGLGRILIDKAICVADTRKKLYIWLSVWEKNNKAIQFYKRNGFYVIKKHPFYVGKDKQTDFIMRKDL